ncbi:MAG: DDE-type integrase/transposase/recombinase [Candidatus Hydrothermarchaeaceae archaeon]
MTDEQKRDIAVFRFGVIHDFVGHYRLDYGEQERLLKDKSDRKWHIPHSGRTRISRATILRWVHRYRESGNKLESLYPKDRSDQGKSRALDEETSCALIRFRREMPGLTVPDLLREMKQRGLIEPESDLNISTVYRFFHQHHLMHPGESSPKDRRKFEAELPNDIWQSDVMHGPSFFVSGRKRKTYLIAFIDDHSRLIPHAEFYVSENLAAFMNAFEKALLKRGMPRKLYVDNGSAFRAKQLEHTAASLGIALIHARPYKPQGKGKIERFFRTIRTGFLPGFTGTSLPEINEALGLWLSDIYHLRRHSGTGQNPFTRFTSRMECIRTAPEDLRDHFRKVVRRRVNKDRSVVVDRRLYEAPVALIGKTVEILFHEESRETVEVRWNHKSYGMLRQVDLHVNCRVRRDKNSQIELEGGTASPESGRLWEE